MATVEVPTYGPRVANFFQVLRHTKGPAAGTSFLLEPWQQEFVNEFYRLDPKTGRRLYRLGVLGIPRGNGKALALDTRVLTSSGWKLMGDLVVGDEVFGPDGTPTRVIAATPPLLGRGCYRVGFSNGGSVVADADHLWLTEERKSNVPALRRTHELAATLRSGHRIRQIETGRVRYLQVTSCDVVPSVPVRCITVDRLDGMFLAGDALVPTHNSPLAAGFGLYEVMTRKDSPDVFCAAGSKEQAQLVQDFANAFVESGGLKRHGIDASRRRITCSRTNGVMRVIASEGSLQHGLSVSAAIVDELHVFVSEGQEEVWAALWTALHKREDSFALAITTAGFNKQTLLGRMYDQALLLEDAEDRLDGCLRIRRDLENGVLFYWYGVPEQLENDWENPELWRAANPASWVSVDELKKQLYGLGGDELDFRRLHLNMWTASRDSWLPHGVWRRCGPQENEDGNVRPIRIPKGADIYVGVDVGWYHDSTAVVWAARVGERIVVKAKVWTTEEGQLGEFVPGGKMRLELVQRFIIDRLKPRFRIRELAYDPTYFGEVADRLQREGVARGKTIEMLPASATTAQAWQAFYQGACEGVIAHSGDPILSAHVDAAAVQMTTNGPRVRKSKATSRIDALSAAVLAYGRCELMTRPSKGAPSVWWFDPVEEQKEKPAAPLDAPAD